MSGFLIVVIIFTVILAALIIALIINTPIFTVLEQQAVVIERLGKFHKVVGPGLNFMYPFGIDRRRKFLVGETMFDYVDQRERAVDLPSQSVITRDNVQLEVDSMAYYQITDPQKAVYGVDNVVLAVNQLIKTVLRDVIGDTMLQELLRGREEINDKLRDQVVRASGDWGITIRSVELQSVTPPQTYVDAMRRVSEAELSKKAAITEAEGKKQASILEAEGKAHEINELKKALIGIDDKFQSNPTTAYLNVKYLDTLQEIANGKATKVFMPFPSNPTGSDFFQQSIGMAAGLDAYKDEVKSPSTPEDDGKTEVIQAPKELPKIGLKLPGDAFVALQAQNVPDEILTKLRPLADRAISGDQFWKAIEQRIGSEQLRKYKGVLNSYVMRVEGRKKDSKPADAFDDV